MTSNNDYAFPFNWENFEGTKITGLGMTKRFYAACVALRGLLANDNVTTDEKLVSDAINIADELLKQLNN